MKKSLIALAVVAASGAASAQSTVTIYGLLDTYVGQQKTNGVSQSVVNSGGLQTSRFGLKGTEDLGGGLKANFVLENGFNIDTGATPNNGPTNSTLFSRQSWVGLSSGLGELKIGKMWTPYDEVKGSGAAGFDANVFAPATNVWASNNYNDRPGNSIYYATPNFGGFSAAGLFSFGENKSATPSLKAGHVASVNVQYAGGPFAIALARQEERIGGLAGAGIPKTKYTQLNSSWDFGVLVLKGAYGQVRDGTNALGAAVDKTKEYQIGLDFPLTSAFTLSGGYAHSKDTLPAGGGELKHKGIGIAGLYALSKRTNLYAGIQNAKQDGTATVAEDKRRTIAVGVRHTF